MKKINGQKEIWGMLLNAIGERNWEEFILGYILLVDSIQKRIIDFPFSSMHLDFALAGAYHAINDFLADFLAEKYPNRNFFEEEDLLHYFLPDNGVESIDAAIEIIKKRRHLPFAHKYGLGEYLGDMGIRYLYRTKLSAPPLEAYLILKQLVNIIQNDPYKFLLLSAASGIVGGLSWELFRQFIEFLGEKTSEILRGSKQKDRLQLKIKSIEVEKIKKSYETKRIQTDPESKKIVEHISKNEIELFKIKIEK